VSRRAWRVIQAVLGLAILVFVVRDFARNWEQIRHTPLEWHVRPRYLVARALVTWSMYGLLIFSWKSLLLDWGFPLGGWTAARIWAVSNLGKYIPGKVWAIAGMAIMAQRAGAAPWAATASAILMQGLAVGTGVLAVALAGISTLEAAYPWIRTAMWLLALASAVGVVIMVSPAISRRLLRRLAPAPAEGESTPRAATVLGAALVNLLAWGGYGVAFWLLSHGLLPDQVPLRLAIGSFAASYLAGLLFLLAPGGLVVRESVMVLMLQGAIGLAPAAALAVASRLMLTMTEVGIAVPFLLTSRESARVST
jgi:uncharacterized membrane protein YbhN (UPF0104 family)